jgi:hypothetical protein
MYLYLNLTPVASGVDHVVQSDTIHGSGTVNKNKILNVDTTIKERLMSYLCYLCLFAYSGVFFVLFIFVWCLLYPMLPVCLDCQFFLMPLRCSSISNLEMITDDKADTDD